REGHRRGKAGKGLIYAIGCRQKAVGYKPAAQSLPTLRLAYRKLSNIQLSTFKPQTLNQYLCRMVFGPDFIYYLGYRSVFIQYKSFPMYTIIRSSHKLFGTPDPENVKDSMIFIGQ